MSGFPDWPNPIRSGAMQCATGATSGMTFRHMYDEVGFPWRKSATGASRFPPKYVRTPAGSVVDAVEPQILGWHILGEARAAIVYPPAVKQDRHTKAPLIFVFHGHGDNAWFATEQFPFQNLWPAAVVVFPQGLPTPAASDPRIAE